MEFIPHRYQQKAIEWIIERPECALFLDMGLGKTVITLTAITELIDRFEAFRVLVIAPLRVARDTWKAEAAKWDHLKGLRMAIAVGTAEERLRALESAADVVIINRENIPWLVEESGCRFDFDMVVVDELSSFKNHQAIRFKALQRVRHRVHRMVGLTGTPSVNGLEDLWSEFRLLDRGVRLGRFIGRFRAEYLVPDKTNGAIVYAYRPKPDAEEVVAEKIRDITLSMKAIDHLDMPELVSTVYPVQMNEAEARQYQALKRDSVLGDDLEVTAANAAALAGKLSQLANGAVYSDDGGVVKVHEQKLDALEDLIESAQGQPILVAYWFRHDLMRIEERLQKTGAKFRRLDSAENLASWNEGQIPVGLIHPASAGHGLNLQAGGNHLVWFGLTWSLELYQQTNARLWRQGQESKTVVIQHIVTLGTIDERILKELERKEMGQDALIEAVRGVL